jgi:serine/threonine protein kinase
LPQDDSASPVTIGEIVAGKYRVERVLGQGGMGVVVAALHIELDQRVALKFLRPHATAHPHVVARFAREARAAAKIHSEHVVRVIDVGVLPTGAPYVVMEFMDGEDLARILLRRGPLSTEVATGYILETCEAIAEAHALGIVHRDLKPANLFLARRTGGRPIVKVLDFGISKSLSASSQGQLTKTTAVVGSPLYMSPEQLMSAKSVDVRSDIWALGVVLYELLTARMPFEGDTLPEVIAAVLHREHEPLRSVRPELPPALDAIIQRCLAKDLTGHFANMDEFAAAVATFVAAPSEA